MVLCVAHKDMRNEFSCFHEHITQTNHLFLMRKVALLVGLAAALGFNNAQAVDLSWKGDVRYRYQSDLTDIPAVTGEHSRDRHRARVRLGVYSWINEELSAGVQIATAGSGLETTSRNETLDDQFLADPVYFNEYFIDYHPAVLNGDVNILLGKRAVANTLIIQNDLVWDSDLTFEGATVQYGKDASGKEKDGLSAVVGYYMLDEISGVQTKVGTPGTGREQDAYLFAGQLAYKGEVSDISYQLGAGYYDYVNFNVDNDPSTKYSPVYDYTGKDFNIVEFFGSFGGQITDTLPWQISGQYAFNTAKKADCVNIDDAKRDSYLAEIKIGDAKQVGQWSLYGDYVRIERDALTVLTDSDRNMGAATDLKGFKIGGVYHLVQNMTLGVNYFNFKTIDNKATTTVDESAPTRHILMADVVVKF
ncbi:MAG: putative porin [Chlorobium sp.]|nr:putative porin [Chlorobium sp.]